MDTFSTSRRTVQPKQYLSEKSLLLPVWSALDAAKLQKKIELPHCMVNRGSEASSHHLFQKVANVAGLLRLGGFNMHRIWIDPYDNKCFE